MSRDTIKFRQSSAYLSDEILFYAKLRKKQVLATSETADMTIDQIIDADLRNLYTTQNPHWIGAWESMQTAKQQALDRYRSIEREACEVVEKDL